MAATTDSYAGGWYGQRSVSRGKPYQPLHLCPSSIASWMLSKFSHMQLKNYSFCRKGLHSLVNSSESEARERYVPRVLDTHVTCSSAGLPCHHRSFIATAIDSCLECADVSYFLSPHQVFNTKLLKNLVHLENG